LARLRLFAQARDCAGTGEATLGGLTVGDVLDAAVERFGTRLADVIAFSAIWLNGEPARREMPVGDDDEVAVLPPVSGG
jgi:molybdopterin converting factor small subunit